MPEDLEITGVNQVDRDLAQLLALGEDPARMATAKSVIADDCASLETLTAAMDESVIRISMALSDPGNAQALLERTPSAARPMVEKAIAIVKANLAGIERHPAIVREMKKELARRKEKRDDLKNRIMRMKWEPLWQDNEGKLQPTARVSFLDERDELLLDSTLDWDDLGFLMRSCARILVRLCRRSESIAKAELLDVSDAEQLSRRISETRSALDELAGIASSLGVDLSEREGDGAPNQPSPARQ